MNSRRIEELAIGAVRGFFLKTDQIAPYLSDNDKEPEWDGSLHIYTGPEQTNEQLFGMSKFQNRVPALSLEKINKKPEELSAYDFHMMDIQSLRN